jgi:nitroimidazol reductase NimA-like FMN-containing flavoprotein (pyridoxamine 5'-phosphate oxidase superfamily)
MPLAEETEMSPEAVDEFLAARETGVLSLARGEKPYAIPISYGYDSETTTFYMRLVSTPRSEKRQFLASSPSARLVVYDRTDDEQRYWSVLASGELEEIDPDQLSLEEIEQYGQARRPLFEVWGQGKDELEINLYRFSPDELSGRRTDVQRE